MMEILQPGLLTTVQDGGRWGFQQYGVPVCGAMDWSALARANLLAGNAMVEARIESLVIAKGYQDCVAFVNDSSVNVIVAKTETGLQDTDVARIRDIVISEANVAAEAIRIIEAE